MLREMFNSSSLYPQCDQPHREQKFGIGSEITVINSDGMTAQGKFTYVGLRQNIASIEIVTGVLSFDIDNNQFLGFSRCSIIDLDYQKILEYVKNKTN